MKPDPVSLLATACGMGASIDDCVFVGDSGSDLVAADRAGVSHNLEFSPVPEAISGSYRTWTC